MIRFLHKAAVLIATIGCTWVVTTSILAHFKEVGEESKPPSQLPPSSKRIGDAGQLAIPEKIATPSNTPVLTLTGFNVTIGGNSVAVEGSVDIYDKRPSVTYVWSLHVLDAADRSVKLANIYGHQAFTTPKSGLMAPTFKDSIQLAPGRYKVILKLNDVATGTDFSTLSGTKSAQALDAIRGVKTIQIND